MAVEFLTLDDVLMLHADQIARYGGAVGVRDPGLLESAIAQPQLAFDGEPVCRDAFEMAAAYLFHIVQNHRSRTGTSELAPSPHFCSSASTASP